MAMTSLLETPPGVRNVSSSPGAAFEGSHRGEPRRIADGGRWAAAVSRPLPWSWFLP